MRVLFICGANKLRSPTAEHVFSDREGIEVSSAGLRNDATNPLTPELLQWAEIIFVMEPSHRRKLSDRFQRYLGGKRVICLDIPDEYDYMEPSLIELLEKKVAPFVRKNHRCRGATVPGKLAGEQ
jgi:predicted protein tyrosine phosphatase